MMSRELNRFVLSVCVAAAMLGCGGSQPPTGAPGALLPPPAAAYAYRRVESSMPPEVKGAYSGDLLYVSDTGANAVEVFTYPAGAEFQTLSNISEPGPLCSDRDGNVFITSYNDDEVYEFTHGTKKP